MAGAHVGGGSGYKRASLALGICRLCREVVYPYLGRDTQKRKKNQLGYFSPSGLVVRSCSCRGSEFATTFVLVMFSPI